jgi:hypothetical protein
MLKETGLEQDLKIYGIWSDWENGTRGRKP